MSVVVLTGLLAFLGLAGSGVLLRWLPCGLSAPRDSWTDATRKTILGLLFVLDADDTRYARRFEEDLFRSLAPGMRQDEVRARIGEPLLTHDLSNERIGWYYSQPGEQTQDYRPRVLIFDSRGVLVARRSSCYLD